MKKEEGKEKKAKEGKKEKAGWRLGEMTEEWEKGRREGKVVHCHLQALMQRGGGVTGVVTPLNLSEVKFSGSTFGSCRDYSDSTVFKFCTSMWLFSALAPALYKGCGLLAAIIFFFQSN